MIIPPYTGVRLVEFLNRIELCPVGWYRDCIALGKFKTNEVGIEPHEEMHEKWKEMMGSNEIWVIVDWMVFENESDTVKLVIYCRPGTTLEMAQKVYRSLEDHLNSSAKDRNTRSGLERLSNQLRHLTPFGTWITHGNLFADADELGGAFASVQTDSGQKTNETREVYQARLKALAGMQPKTVALIHQAEQAKDESERQKLEREAVQAFFAEAGTYWKEDMIMAWQRNNPLGSKWLCEFGKMMEEPERHLDPINHELALNWLRRGYNLMTENELSEAVLKATGQHVRPNTLKIKRSRLGLSTKRRFGPDSRAYQ